MEYFSAGEVKINTGATSYPWRTLRLYEGEPIVLEHDGVLQDTSWDSRGDDVTLNKGDKVTLTRRGSALYLDRYKVERA